MTFDLAMERTREISSATAFDDAECRAFYDLLIALPQASHVVEIGCQFGRSSSVILQARKGMRDSLVFIDPFIQHPKEAAWRWMENVSFSQEPFCLLRMMSTEAARWIEEPIDLLLIDGDHSALGVSNDCYHYLPKVRSGGYVCLHDWNRESIPQVTLTALRFLEGWEAMGTFGTLGVFRKP